MKEDPYDIDFAEDEAEGFLTVNQRIKVCISYQLKAQPRKILNVIYLLTHSPTPRINQKCLIFMKTSVKLTIIVFNCLFCLERTEEASSKEKWKDGGRLCSCCGGGVSQGRCGSHLRPGGEGGEGGGELPGEDEEKGPERGKERNSPGRRAQP